MQIYTHLDFSDSFWSEAKAAFDSRKIIDYQRSIFFCLAGHQHDPHQFVLDLYQKGLRRFVVGRILPEFERCTGATFVQVGQPLRLLQSWAAWHRGRFACPVVAITGSNGKTVVKEWLFELLNNDLALVKSPKSYNSQLGVPLSVLELRPQHQLAIFEAGISTVGEMVHLQQIIQPDWGIFTNIGEAHSGGFVSLEAKIREKMQLFRHCKGLIYSSRQPILSQIIRQLCADWGLQSYSWGQQKEDYFQLRQQFLGGQQSQINLVFEGKELIFNLPFSDAASVENASHVLVAALLLQKNISASALQKRLLELKNLSMRLEKKEGINGCILIDDSYNNDLAGLKIGLDFLAQQVENKHFVSKTVILSDMLEQGQNDADLYQSVAEWLQAAKVQKLLAVGQNLTRCQKLFQLPETRFFENTNQLLEVIGQNLRFKDEAILIKGARAFGFERITQLLSKKIHSSLLEINLNALAHNFLFYKNQLRPSTKMMAMVKAFAYGSGSVEVAQLLQYQQVDYLGVAYADEGVSLREHGIYTPIMVLNVQENNFNQLQKYRLEPVIYSFSLLKNYLNFLKNNQLAQQPVHIEIDTGMRRLGFDPAEWSELLELLRAHPNTLLVRSVFSHLAAAEDEQHDEFTRSQIGLFEQFNQLFAAQNPPAYLRHLLNSAGIIRWQSAQYDMVRLGIGLYGIDSSGQQQAQLQTVTSLKASISQIRTLDPAQTVGYSRKGRTDKPTKVATISIGYADGFLRVFGNGKASVWLNGRFCPTIGNICMDMCFIDLGDSPAQEGDMVEIFGENADIQTLAKIANTIPYEILTNVGERVSRIFYD